MAWRILAEKWHRAVGSTLGFVFLAALAAACSTLQRGGGQNAETENADTSQADPVASPVFSSAGSASVGFAGGMVSMAGISLEIPPGALGAFEEIPVEIQASTQNVAVPEFMAVVGGVHDIGPEGTMFAEPVRVSLPIPDGADPEDLLGIMTEDAETGSWTSLSSVVDAGGDTMSAVTTHLSPFAIVGGRRAAAAWGGWVRVANPYVKGTASFPGSGLPMHLENLLCFTNYAPINLDHLVRPAWDVVVATASWGWTTAERPKTVEYWLPAGTYSVEQSIFASEINTNPLHSPDVAWWTRPVTSFIVAAGETIAFEDYPPPPLPPAADTGFVATPNSCARRWSPLAGSAVDPFAEADDGPAADLARATPTTIAADPIEVPPAADTGAVGWFLTSVEPSQTVADDGGCYHGAEVIVGGLTASTFMRCTATGPTIDVWNRSEHEWSAAPPEHLGAGDQLRITGTTSMEGTYHTGGMTGSGSTWVRIDLDPGGGPYAGYAWANAHELDTPVSALNDFSIPSGAEGNRMYIMLSFQGPGGSGRTTYAYEWQGP